MTRFDLLPGGKNDSEVFIMIMTPFLKNVKKRVFLESFPKCLNPPTHPGAFVRFGKTKGEIRVKNDTQGFLNG